VPEPWENPSPWLPDVPPVPALIGRAAPTPSDAVTPLPRGGEMPVAYIPARRFHPGDTTARFELRLLADGRSALLAYTSLDLLVAGCGEAQPWVAVRLAALDGLAKLARLCDADEALWDVNIPPEARQSIVDETDPKGSGE
jgi:hypothetical protein